MCTGLWIRQSYTARMAATADEASNPIASTTTATGGHLQLFPLTDNPGASRICAMRSRGISSDIITIAGV